MATFRFHTRVATDPDRVWAVLTDVDLIPDWFPGIDSAVFDGSHRVLTLTSGARLRARVVTHDPELRRFQYSFVEGMPLPIDFHLGTLDVLEDGAGSLVIYSQQIEPDELATSVGPAVAGGIAGISAYFTTGPGAPVGSGTTAAS